MDHNIFVTVVNRTQETLTGTWDSRQYEFAPGSKSEHAKDRAIKFRDQNPVMGSENPRTGSIIYKLGIPEMDDPCDPLSPALIAKYEGSIEKWDRAQLTGACPTEVVPGDNGIYSVRDVNPSLPLSTSFTNPNS